MKYLSFSCFVFHLLKILVPQIWYTEWYYWACLGRSQFFEFTVSYKRYELGYLGMKSHALNKLIKAILKIVALESLCLKDIRKKKNTKAEIIINPSNFRHGKSHADLFNFGTIGSKMKTNFPWKCQISSLKTDTICLAYHIHRSKTYSSPAGSNWNLSTFLSLPDTRFTCCEGWRTWTQGLLLEALSFESFLS